MELENIFTLLLIFVPFGFIGYKLYQIGRVNMSLSEKNLFLDELVKKIQDDLDLNIQDNKILNNTINTSKDTYTETSMGNRALQDRNEELTATIQKWESWKSGLEENYKRKTNQLSDTLASIEKTEKNKVEKESEKFNTKKLDDERTWQNWEATVENRIRLICDDNTLKYISQEDYPSSKKPDNSVEIANQFIIFDAKSPKSHDKLHAFKTTITLSINKMDKYSGDKTLDVSKDMYLVLPQVAIDMFDSKYNKGDYTVHVVGLDALEPIILSLSKLQNYFTADKLTPEEKENLSRYIGTSNNMLKRVSFINNKVSEAINEHVIKSDYLPKDISEKSKEHEKGHQLNITNQQKGGSIALETLVDETKKISLLNSLNTKEENTEN
tara:strand:+ start:383 stop:1531 length:1149 start_codon:yes stop_codon:yes gene_type:complete